MSDAAVRQKFQASSAGSMNWQAHSIGEIMHVVTKGTTPTTLGRQFTDSGVNFIKAEALNGDSGLDTGGFFHIDEDTHELLGRSVLQEDDVLVTRAGAQVGKCGYVKGEHLPANTNQAVGIVRINKDKAVPRFVYYFFKQARTFTLFQSLGGQAAQPNVNLTVLKSVRVPLPSLDTQEMIASILSSYDDLIENNRRRMKLLEESARQLYQEWFVRLRFPGHEHTKIIDGVPEGWERIELKTICREICDNVIPEDLDSDTPYIGLEHMPRRSISLIDWGKASEVTSTKHQYKMGDILFGKIRPYFHKVGIVFTDGVTSSDSIVLRPCGGDLRSFVLMTVSSDEFVAEASQTMREGSKMPRADWKLMMRYSINLPNQNLLRNFSETVTMITDQLGILCFQNQKLRAARDLLLPRLMSGDIEV